MAAIRGTNVALARQDSERVASGLPCSPPAWLDGLAGGAMQHGRHADLRCQGAVDCVEPQQEATLNVPKFALSV